MRQAPCTGAVLHAAHACILPPWLAWHPDTAIQRDSQHLASTPPATTNSPTHDIRHTLKFLQRSERPQLVAAYFTSLVSNSSSTFVMIFGVFSKSISTRATPAFMSLSLPRSLAS